MCFVDSKHNLFEELSTDLSSWGMGNRDRTGDCLVGKKGPELGNFVD